MLQRRLKKEAGVDVVFKRVVTIGDHLCKLKPPKAIMEKKGSIYHIPCKDCDKPYVGETKVRLKKRLDQHKGRCKAMDMKMDTYRMGKGELRESCKSYVLYQI